MASINDNVTSTAGSSMATTGTMAESQILHFTTQPNSCQQKPRHTPNDYTQLKS